MKFKNLFIYTQTIAVISCLAGNSSQAFDLSLLKNDKEAKTHAYNALELKTAQRKIGRYESDSISEKAFKLLGETLSESEKKGKLCDLPVLQKFLAKLERAQISNSHQSLINLLIIWRSQNLIDDLFFEVMEQSSVLNDAIPLYSFSKVRRGEVKRSEKLITDKKIKNEELASIYSDLNGSDLYNIGCSTDTWLSISKNLSFASAKTSKVRTYNVAANNKNMISEESYQYVVDAYAKGLATKEELDDATKLKSTKILSDVSLELAEFYRINNVNLWDINLKKYLGIMRDAKNSSRIGETKDADLKPNVLSSKLKDKKSKITYRQSLYYHFNSMQIGMISDVLKKTFERMDATKTEVVFTFKNGSETLPVSPMGQYFLARKLLKKDIEELSRSTFFGGMNITHEDLITAALETGLINPDMLDSALKIDDLWNPEVKQWTKIANYAFRVTGTATLFLPPPYNVISSIALVFIEGLVSRKANKSVQQDNSYDFF